MDTAYFFQVDDPKLSPMAVCTHKLLLMHCTEKMIERRRGSSRTGEEDQMERGMHIDGNVYCLFFSVIFWFVTLKALNKAY